MKIVEKVNIVRITTKISKKGSKIMKNRFVKVAEIVIINLLQ